MNRKTEKNFGPAKGQLLGDSWFIKVRKDYHAFYLQAPPSEIPGERRSRRKTIGHAISKDLTNWNELPVALGPGRDDDWDNLSPWTGSIIEKDGTYFMPYTGVNSDPDKIWIQKIGMATSDDLITWKKYKNNPILKAKDPYYIDNKKNILGVVGAWRDPFIFKDPDSDNYYMTISARLKGKQREYNGCVAIVKSQKDLFHWKILPPILAPGFYDEMETTQVIFHAGKVYLFFSTHARNYKPDFARYSGGAFGGLHCYFSNNLFGQYKPVNGNGVVLANEDEIYDVRLILNKDNDFFGIGWLKTKEGRYVGKMSAPLKLRIDEDRIFKVD